jgi:hypothetical protein
VKEITIHLLLLSLLLFASVRTATRNPAADATPPSLRPGSRVLLDAHNCYPYHGKWADRMERALGTGLPLAIEQDLCWYTDARSGRSWSIVSHGKPFSGNEPTLKQHFFERVRPIIEKAINEDNSRDWPLITLNLDFKAEEPAHLAAIWSLVGEYEDWLCTAERGPDIHRTNPLRLRPVLVLTGDSVAQQKAFHDDVPVAQPLRLFGSFKSTAWLKAPLESSIPPANNYRRWWNNSWVVVEKGGQHQAGDWSEGDDRWLKSLVHFAHAQGLWIRFYTLNGHLPDKSLGWAEGYNFGSEEQVRARWKAAIEVGVDFIATDQYEMFGIVKRDRIQTGSLDSRAVRLSGDGQ